MDDILDRLDDYDDGRTVCPNCNESMVTDEMGDGVMAMTVEYCENCGGVDEGSPLAVTEKLLAFKREQENTT